MAEIWDNNQIVFREIHFYNNLLEEGINYAMDLREFLECIRMITEPEQLKGVYQLSISVDRKYKYKTFLFVHNYYFIFDQDLLAISFRFNKTVEELDKIAYQIEFNDDLIERERIFIKYIKHVEFDQLYYTPTNRISYKLDLDQAQEYSDF